MATTFLLFSDLLVPLFTGLFFLFYFGYFVIANPSKAPSYRYFLVFLVGFGIFLFGRPLQLILGPYPIPLVIVNIRVFVLCAVISPAIILASDVFNKQKRKYSDLTIVAVCVLLGLTYCVFNTLGTKGSYELFEFAGITARDNLTPAKMPPFYGREVTIAVQVITGVLLLSNSVLKLFRLKLNTAPSDFIRNKNFLINIGILIFALSFIVGSLAKQWWMYYATSIVSALLFGGSVLIDIREIHNYYEKLIPFIKEDIVHNVAFSEFSKIKLAEMLDCLGKKPDLNTFIVLKIKEKEPESTWDFGVVDDVLAVVNRCLGEKFNDERFLLLPLSNTRVGIIMHLPRNQDGIGRFQLIETLETIQEEIRKKYGCGVAMGIGRSYDKMEDLRISYREAATAQEYAEQFEENSIIHVENISESGRHANKFPVKEKEQLLSSIKLGDSAGSMKTLDEFIAKFLPFVEERPEILKVRLYELIGAFIDAANLGGGDEKRLNELIGEYVADIDHIKNPAIAEKWLKKVVYEITESVVHVLERRSISLVRKAVEYIEAHYDSQLGYKDVAKEVFVSPSYFLTLFKQETGMTFVDYLTTVRINRAKTLLLTTDLSITQIAYDTGFNSSNYFSSLFRKMVGVSAKEFRVKKG